MNFFIRSLLIFVLLSLCTTCKRRRANYSIKDEGNYLSNSKKIVEKYKIFFKSYSQLNVVEKINKGIPVSVLVIDQPRRGVVKVMPWEYFSAIIFPR